jgi:tyrosine-specific transport protein
VVLDLIFLPLSDALAPARSLSTVVKQHTIPAPKSRWFALSEESKADVAESSDVDFATDVYAERQDELIQSVLGYFDEQRLIFPELSSGEVTRLFSSLEYKKSEDGKLTAAHAAGSTLGAAALVTGTTVGAGILALPAATAASGFVPSSVAMVVAWAYMTMSGLLVAELSLNRFGETGRPGLGLLDLYESSMGKGWGMVGSAAYFFLHYAMMVAYIAQGGANFDGFLNSLGLDAISSLPGSGQLLFAAFGGLAMYYAKPSLVENVNNLLVFGVFASFLAIIGLGTGTADFGALIDPSNQHPENVLSTFPFIFLALVYQNIVPTVVAQLEGDRAKIVTAITTGTTIPLIMFLAWNAIILGNVPGKFTQMDSFDPVALLQRDSSSGEVLSTLVGCFSELALITSLIGFVYGLLSALTDVFGLAIDGPGFQKWKPVLFAGVFLPPLVLSTSNNEIFYKALDYGGAFGVSTLFLLLPPIMVWKSRYNEDSPLLTKPMVGFGKFPLATMMGAAGALVIQQAIQKSGVLSFVQDLLLQSRI